MKNSFERLKDLADREPAIKHWLQNDEYFSLSGGLLDTLDMLVENIDNLLEIQTALVQEMQDGD